MRCSTSWLIKRFERDEIIRSCSLCIGTKRDAESNLSKHFIQHHLSPQTIEHDSKVLSYARQVLDIEDQAQLAYSLEGAERSAFIACAWGLAFIEYQRWDLLVAICIRALEYDQRHVDLMLLLSFGLASIGEASEALIVLERVFELVEYDGSYFQLSLNLAEHFQAQLSSGGPSLNELPTFNMSMPDELLDFTDTSLSIIKVKEWLEGVDESDIDLDGPTENLTHGDLKKIIEIHQSSDDLSLSPTENIQVSMEPNQALEHMIDDAEPSSVYEVFDSVDSVILDSGPSGLSSASWELSSEEEELELASPSDPDTLSVYDLDAISEPDSISTKISSNSLQTRAVNQYLLDDSLLTSAQTRLDPVQVSEASRPLQEDSVVTSAHQVSTPPRVPPPAIQPSMSSAPAMRSVSSTPSAPPMLPSVIMKDRPPSLPPSTLRPPPQISAPPKEISPKVPIPNLPIPNVPIPNVLASTKASPALSRSILAESDGEFHQTPSTRALADNHQNDLEVSTKAIPRMDNYFDVNPSTKAIPESPSSFHGNISTRALDQEELTATPQENRLFSSPPASLAPKPLEALKAPDIPPFEYENVSDRSSVANQEDKPRQPLTPPAHIGELTTSMFEISEDEISFIKGSAPKQKGSSLLFAGSLFLMILSMMALLLGFGFQQQQKLLQNTLTQSTYVSDENYINLGKKLDISAPPPTQWPRFVTQILSTQIGLSTKAGQRLDALKAWVEMVSWVGYGRDDRQEEALKALSIALRSSPRTSYTLGALSLYLSAMSADDGALAVAQMIKSQSWLRGLSLGLIYERSGYSEQALQALQDSDLINPSSTLTQQLILSILDRYRSTNTSLELKRRQARFGIHKAQLLWATPSILASEVKHGSEISIPNTPLEQLWVMSLLVEQNQSEFTSLKQQLIDQQNLMKSPKSRQLLFSLRYARLTLNQEFLRNSAQIIEERYLQGQITLTERELSLFELALSKGDTTREAPSTRYTPHPKLQAMIPFLKEQYPDLKSNAFEQRVNQDHYKLATLEVQRLLQARSWTALRVLSGQRAKQMTRATLARIEAFTRSLTADGVKALPRLLKAQEIQFGPDVHAVAYPNELLISYAMDEAGQAERAARFALSYSQHSRLSSEAQLNSSLFICRALDEVALLPSQWLSCKSSYERAPYRYDASEGYALLLEELGELEEASELIKPLLQNEVGSLSTALERLLLRLNIQSPQGTSLNDATSSLGRYRGAIQLLRDGLYMSGARALSQQPGATRLERFEYSALLSRLAGDTQELNELADKGSLAAQLYRWMSKLKEEGRNPSPLAINAAIGSPQIARLTELVDLMSCFAREGQLDLHHIEMTTKALTHLPPPAQCRVSYQSLLKTSFNRHHWPPYVQHMIGLLFLSVGEVSAAEKLWLDLLKDPIRSLEAKLALGLLYQRQNRSRMAEEIWKPLISERSKLSSQLRQILRR